MKTRLAICGAGGFGREVAVMIAQINQHQPMWNVIGFFDDHKKTTEPIDGLPVLGNIDQINHHLLKLSICIAVADPVVRASIVRRITNPAIDFPAIIHPSAILGDENRNSVGAGTIITAGVILTTGIAISEFCIVNLASTIGHDVNLGSYCTIMPGCSISGNVSIGQQSLMGTGSRILQGITIGENCIIGAGSVVTKSFGENLKLLGVPARKRIHHVERI